MSRTSGAPPAIYERSRSATFTLGAILGAFGGIAALVVAGVVRSKHLVFDANIAAQIGHALHKGANGGFAFAAIIGFLYGGVLALVMRHAARFFARVIFGTVAGVLAYFCLHIGLVSRHAQLLPLAPMLAGAAIFGLFVACVPSARRI